MAIRINNAKDFAGRTYLNTDDLARLAGLLGLSSSTASAVTASKIVTTDTNGHFVYKNAIVDTVAASGSTAATNIPNETAIRTAIDAVANQAINITAGNGVTITGVQDSTEKIISTNLKIKKLGNATTGYAASYQLQYLSDASNGTYTAVDGDTIDIVKDQFLKGAVLGYGTYTDNMTSDPADWGTTADPSKDAILKLTFAITKDEGDQQTGTDTDSYVYIKVTDLFKDKTAGVGIDGTAMTSNIIAVKIDSTSEAVYTAAGTTAAVLSVGVDGVKAANVQAAIDNAVTAEHATASAAISSLNANVSTLAAQTSASVSGLNARIVTVATNAENAATNLENEINALDTKVSGAISAVNTNIQTAVTSALANVSAAITTHTTSAVQLITTTADITAGTTGVETIVIDDTAATCVVAVYDGGYQQIYPEIKKDGTSNKFQLTADFGTSAASAETWTILYTKALTAYNADAVVAGSASYAVTAKVDKAVGSGTAAPDVTASSDVTKTAPSYKQNA